MGGLIPNPNDMEVVDGLNARFSGTKLQMLRNHIQNKNDDFFAHGRHLRRITWRLKIFPTSGNRPKGRWLTFLKDILPQSIHDQILTELRSAVGNPAQINNNCVGVRFWAVYEPNLKNNYELVVETELPDANGQYWKSITLKCLQEIDPNVNGDPNDPPGDNGENGPPQPSFRRPPKGKRKKSVKRPKGGKKVSKKKSKKR